MAVTMVMLLATGCNKVTKVEVQKGTVSQEIKGKERLLYSSEKELDTLASRGIGDVVDWKLATEIASINKFKDEVKKFWQEAGIRKGNIKNAVSRDVYDKNFIPGYNEIGGFSYWNGKVWQRNWCGPSACNFIFGYLDAMSTEQNRLIPNRNVVGYKISGFDLWVVHYRQTEMYIHDHNGIDAVKDSNDIAIDVIWETINPFYHFGYAGIIRK